MENLPLTMCLLHRTHEDSQERLSSRSVIGTLIHARRKVLKLPTMNLILNGQKDQVKKVGRYDLRANRY
jgi:hypothetical protein